MPKGVRFAALISLILIGSAAIAAADIVQDLTVHLFQTCPDGACYEDSGYDGSPATGYADFSSIAPWSFGFSTGEALQWWYCCGGIVGVFGQGGSFGMTGPYDLTFAGIVTSGYSWVDGLGGAGADVTFFGQWSNGLYGGGEASSYWVFPNIFYATLDTYVAPEPTSLGLMASGVLGIWGCRKRFFG